MFYLFGASGFVGQRLFNKLGPERCLGTHRSTHLHDTVFFESGISSFKQIYQPDFNSRYAVILLGDTKVDSCKINYEQSQKTNVSGIKKLINELFKFEVKPIFISSEYVYDGSVGDYSEEHPISPNTVYGMQKVAIEEHLQSSGKDYCILRLPKVLGTKLGDGTLLTSWVVGLSNEKHFKLATDQIHSVTHLDDICDGIIKVVNLNLSGIYNLCAPHAYNRVDMIKILSEKLGLRVDVEECSINDFRFQDNRPLNISLNPSKIIREISLKFKTLCEICQEIADEI